MLYRDMYWFFKYILALHFVLLLSTTAVWQFVINEYVMLCYVTIDRHAHSAVKSKNNIKSIKVMKTELRQHRSHTIKLVETKQNLYTFGEGMPIHVSWSCRSDRRHYSFGLSVRVCARPCAPGQKHSPTGLPSTSSFELFVRHDTIDTIRYEMLF